MIPITTLISLTLTVGNDTFTNTMNFVQNGEVVISDAVSYIEDFSSDYFQIVGRDYYALSDITEIGFTFEYLVDDGTEPYSATYSAFFDCADDFSGTGRGSFTIYFDNAYGTIFGNELPILVTPFIYDIDQGVQYYPTEYFDFEYGWYPKNFVDTLSTMDFTVSDDVDDECTFGLVVRKINWYYYADVVSDTTWQDGYNYGFAEGKTEGLTIGYDNGKTEGITIGESTGYSTGYNDGYTSGQVAGYNTGYNDGLNTANQYSFDNLFKSIVDTPIWFLQSIMGFELFGTGTSLIAIVTSLVTLCLLIMLIKKVF